MDAPTVASLTTVAGAALLTGVLMEYVVWRVLRLSEDAMDRFGPFLAIATGIVVVEVATFTVVTGVTRLDLVQGAVNGVFAGLSAIGLHSIAKRVVPE